MNQNEMPSKAVITVAELLVDNGRLKGELEEARAERDSAFAESSRLEAVARTRLSSLEEVEVKLSNTKAELEAERAALSARNAPRLCGDCVHFDPLGCNETGLFLESDQIDFGCARWQKKGTKS